MDGSKIKGFTLVELLVVIAIIGILSSIVIGSLNGARTKGNDAVVKAELAGIKPHADIWYDNTTVGGTNGSYGDNTTVCATDGNGTVTATGMFADDSILPTLVDIKKNGASGSVVVCNVSDDGQKWATSISALKNAETSWCVDNSGAASPNKNAQGGICVSN
ncbi:MAG: type II secretion system protein [Patescibacteria group bacterium]